MRLPRQRAVPNLDRQKARAWRTTSRAIVPQARGQMVGSQRPAPGVGRYPAARLRTAYSPNRDALVRIAEGRRGRRFPTASNEINNCASGGPQGVVGGSRHGDPSRRNLPHLRSSTARKIHHDMCVGATTPVPRTYRRGPSYPQTGQAKPLLVSLDILWPP